jgi:hypothetical protein
MLFNSLVFLIVIELPIMGSRTGACLITLDIFKLLFNSLIFLIISDFLVRSVSYHLSYTKGRDGTLTEAFCTEVVLNSLNPTWIAKHTIIFQF